MKLSIPDDVIFETVDDQVVLLSLNGGNYYKLNGTGTRIWHLIREHGDLGEVETAMIEEYEADPPEIRRDVRELINDLEAHGLVKSGESHGRAGSQ